MAGLSVLVGALMGAVPTPAGAATANVTADFSVDNGVGHAEVFGSSINVPYLTDPDKIETLHQSGTRFVRGDAYLGEILPTTTIADYLASMRTGVGVSDPSTWNWGHYGWVDEHHNRGARIMLILSYSANWLGTTPGGPFWDISPPGSDDGYRVYRDAVKKIYQHFRGKVDMVEVWNEPDTNTFMDLSNTNVYGHGMTGKYLAYKSIFLNAAQAVRSVDPDIPIGGPTLSKPDLLAWNGIDPNDRIPWANMMLSDSEMRPYLDFLSFHSYDFGAGMANAVTNWKQVARGNGRGNDFPVYVDEWNYDFNYYNPPTPNNPMNGNHPNTISYAAERLTQFYKEHANGTNFFADNDQALEPHFFGVHSNGMLIPKARTYRLMSVDLGLGAGDSTIRPTTYPGTLSNAGAATTATGDQVVWAVNDTPLAQEVDFTLTGLGATTATTANVFEASPIQTQVRPKVSVPLSVSGGSATVRATVPQRSVVGVRLSATPIADNENLARSAAITPSTSASDQYAGRFVADGVIRRHGTGEWAARSDDPTPSIRLDWAEPTQIGQVVLYDRPNYQDHVTAGRLEFSNGITVPVPELPNDGVGKAVSFPFQNVTWMRFVVTGSDPSRNNLGLSELQVFSGANVAKDGTVTTSSQADPRGQVKATDGITTAAGEWVSTETNPWIRLDWVNTHTVNRVVLFDRPGDVDANSGTLTFSDGSSVPVTDIPTDGSPKAVEFPARPVNWVRFEVTGGSGPGVGLAELRVLAAGNLAASARVTAKNATNDPELQPSAVADGVVNQWYAGEWASAGDQSPWIQLTWDTAQTVGQVELFDRANTDDFTTGGTLRFSDGSTVPVSGMDNSGTGKVVRFTPRTVTWVRFEITSTTTTRNAGLAEIEVYRT